MCAFPQDYAGNLCRFLWLVVNLAIKFQIVTLKREEEKEGKKKEEEEMEEGGGSWHKLGPLEIMRPTFSNQAGLIGFFPFSKKNYL